MAARNGAKRPPSGPSLAEVASHAGVSVGTVSHVLNHPERVRPATRQNVQEAIEQLGFVRNSNASSLAGGNNPTFGFVAIDIGNSLFVDIARGAQSKAHSEGFILQLGHSDNSDDVQDRHLDAFNSARAAGILLAPMRDPREAMARVRRLGTPVVVINYEWQDPSHCSVVIDNVKAGYLAARHMIETGRRHIAFVAGKFEFQPVSNRRIGVRRAIREAGEAVRYTEIEIDDINAIGGAEAAEHILRMDLSEAPDGVIGVTDMLAMGTIQTLRAAGRVVPGDHAVMGSDYNVNAWGGSVPLTSIKMHGETIGAAAVDLLLEEIRGVEHTHRRVIIEPTLEVRQSTSLG